MNYYVGVVCVCGSVWIHTREFTDTSFVFMSMGCCLPDSVQICDQWNSHRLTGARNDYTSTIFQHQFDLCLFPCRTYQPPTHLFVSLFCTVSSLAFDVHRNDESAVFSISGHSPTRRHFVVRMLVMLSLLLLVAVWGGLLLVLFCGRTDNGNAINTHYVNKDKLNETEKSHEKNEKKENYYHCCCFTNRMEMRFRKSRLSVPSEFDFFSHYLTPFQSDNRICLPLEWTRARASTYSQIKLTYTMFSLVRYSICHNFVLPFFFYRNA